MSKTIMNLTLPAVNQEIETVLETYPDHPYQQAFARPELRERLVAYVLSQVDCKFTVVEEGQEPQINSELQFPSPEQQAQVADVIHQGIQRLFNEVNEVNEDEGGDWLNDRVPELEAQAGEAPSHWFG